MLLWENAVPEVNLFRTKKTEQVEEVGDDALYFGLPFCEEIVV